MYYHSVGLINPLWKKNFLTLETRYFEDQLQYFSKNFRVITLNEYQKIRTGELKPIPKALVLSFDDGYLDNWIWAYPLLKKYSLPATIFISPEFVDQRNIVRPNLEEVWKGKAKISDLQQWGFLSWDEMREMENSGLISIESHTMTHTKYFVSDKLTGFHHPGADSIYAIANLFPERKPYYIEDREFDRLIPYGFPLFEMQSSVTARKVEINPEFTEYCIQAFRNFDFESYKFNEAFDKVKEKYLEFKNKQELILSTENDDTFEKRLRDEIFESKRIIEKELNKTVDFLCWPHGDNNSLTNQMAWEAGYLGTSLGKQKADNENEFRFERVGTGSVRNNRFLSLMKAKYKIGSMAGREPYYSIRKIYKYFKPLV